MLEKAREVVAVRVAEIDAAIKTLTAEKKKHLDNLAALEKEAKEAATPSKEKAKT